MGVVAVVAQTPNFYLELGKADQNGWLALTVGFYPCAIIQK